jgi:hypothetical protein
LLAARLLDEQGEVGIKFVVLLDFTDNNNLRADLFFLGLLYLNRSNIAT